MKRRLLLGWAAISRVLRRAAQLVLPLWLQSRIRPGLDSLVLATCKPGREKDFGAILCLHGLGDVILAARCIERLAQFMRSRKLKVRLFVAPQNVTFARRYLDVDEVEGLDWILFERDLWYRAWTVRAIAHGSRYALVVQPTLNRRLAVVDSIVRATRARERWGAVGSPQFIYPFERGQGDSFYNRLIPHSQREMHDLERHREFMAELGLAIEASPWRLRTSPKPPLEGPYLALCPQASDVVRTWNQEGFQRAALAVAQSRGWAVVVLGSTVGQKLDWPSDGPPLIDLRGQTASEDLPALLAAAELVLSNDSGPYHLGIALGRPTLGVGGSGMLKRYFPYPEEASLKTRVVHRKVACEGCCWTCIHVPPVITTAWCIQQVSWPEVAAAAEALLGVDPS